MSFPPPAVLSVTAGPDTGCRGCTLCGCAENCSPSTGSLSCCAPCTTRSETHDDVINSRLCPVETVMMTCQYGESSVATQCKWVSKPWSQGFRALFSYFCVYVLPPCGQLWNLSCTFFQKILHWSSFIDHFSYYKIVYTLEFTHVCFSLVALAGEQTRLL